MLIKRRCKNCDKEFLISKYKSENGRGQYCSKKCIELSQQWKLTDHQKYCPKCNAMKDFENFYVDKNGVLSGWCKSCHVDYTRKFTAAHKEQVAMKNKEWRSKHPEYSLEYKHATGKSRPMSEATKCASYLGIYIAESILVKYFENSIRMPLNNKGFDYICGMGYKIDVKSSCLSRNKTSKPYWTFVINHNKIADYFLCLGFDNRSNLEPQHIWIIPSCIVNSKFNIKIQNTPKSLSKWLQYEKPIDKVKTLCNEMKENTKCRFPH